MTHSKNGRRGRPASSTADKRREDQLDLFGRAEGAAPITPPLGAARRAKSAVQRKRLDAGVFVQLGLK